MHFEASQNNIRHWNIPGHQEKPNSKFELGFSYPSRRRRLGMESVAKRRHDITSKTCMASPKVHLRRLDSIHHFVMIPYATASQFHTATSYGFHTRLRRDFFILTPPVRLSVSENPTPQILHLPFRRNARKSCLLRLHSARRRVFFFFRL